MELDLVNLAKGLLQRMTATDFFQNTLYIWAFKQLIDSHL